MKHQTFNRAFISAALLAVCFLAGCITGHKRAKAHKPADQPRLAIVFAGDRYAEEARPMLDDLKQRHIQASFFLSGYFLTNASFAPLVKRMEKEGHYVGPRLDPPQALVTRKQFEADLKAAEAKLPGQWSLHLHRPRFLLPANEQYNPEIAGWSARAGFTLVNFTPGTLATEDTSGEGSGTNFVSSQAIFDSILKKEHDDPNGLNGFILLLRVGSGPMRADKFGDKLGALLDVLGDRGYRFVRIDELPAGARK